jgi:hypothetical protein
MNWNSLQFSVITGIERFSPPQLPNIRQIFDAYKRLVSIFWLSVFICCNLGDCLTFGGKNVGSSMGLISGDPSDVLFKDGQGGRFSNLKS